MTKIKERRPLDTEESVIDDDITVITKPFYDDTNLYFDKSIHFKIEVQESEESSDDDAHEDQEPDTSILIGTIKTKEKNHYTLKTNSSSTYVDKTI